MSAISFYITPGALISNPVAVVRSSDATDFARHAVDGARKVLGSEHPNTKKYEHLLQELLAKVGAGDRSGFARQSNGRCCALFALSLNCDSNRVG
jgi:hypothetical protein